MGLAQPSNEDEHTYNLGAGEKLLILPILKEKTLRESLLHHNVDPDWLLRFLDRNVPANRAVNELSEESNQSRDFLKDKIDTNVAAILRIALKADVESPSIAEDLKYLSIETIRTLERELESVRAELKHVRESLGK